MKKQTSNIIKTAAVILMVIITTINCAYAEGDSTAVNKSKKETTPTQSSSDHTKKKAKKVARFKAGKELSGKM